MLAKKSLNYKIEPEKYLFGIGEVFEGAIDNSIKPQNTIEIIKKMGFGSMRLWMHNKSLLNRDANNNTISLNDEAILRYHHYIDEIIRGGTTHLIAMNHSYLYPYDFKGNQKSEAEIPLPNTATYQIFLDMLEESYYILSKEFPMIIYWEVGNEVNMHRFICKPNFPLGKFTEKDYDERFCYTYEEKAQITADICYYSNLGIKRGNPKAYVVFPAPTPYFGYTDCSNFFDLVYKAIESGLFPRGRKADTNADNYFQVLSWHPYNFGGDYNIFVNGCKEIYQTAINHGDAGKKVFITEFGYHDFDLMKSNMTKEEADAKQASFLRTDFKAYKEQLPFVETVHIFRLYDWSVGPNIEVDFGLFTSPQKTKTILPKEKGKVLYELINGKKAKENELTFLL